MSDVNIITRAFHYYYDPRTGTRITTPGNGEPWYVELTPLLYDAVGLLLAGGGYDAIAEAMYKCGLSAPSYGPNTTPDYVIGECWQHGCKGEKPVRYFSYDQNWLCREHYEQAAAKVVAGE